MAARAAHFSLNGFYFASAGSVASRPPETELTSRNTRSTISRGVFDGLRSLATRGPKHPAGPPRRSPGRLAQRFHDAEPAATSKSAAASADLSIANSKHWNLAIRGRTLQLAIQQCFWLPADPPTGPSQSSPP